ncbi:hypothetical protein GCM10023080_070180 [Streptomyces pseudoechinosporeus]
MRGRLVSLTWPDQDDWAAIARWVRPASPAAVLTNDWEPLSPQDVEDINRSGRVRHLIIEVIGGEKVGVVSYRKVGREGSYSIGTAVGDPELWNRGYAADASVLLVDYLFHQLGAHRVEATTALFNRDVTRTMIRGPFVLEGILRDYYFLDGEYHHAAAWSMLRNEYYESLNSTAASQGNPPVLEFLPGPAKEEARRLVEKYLAGDPVTSLSQLTGKHPG